MKSSRLLSTVCVLLALALGAIATSACTTDGVAASARSSNGGGGY